MKHTVQELIHNQSFRRMVKGSAHSDELTHWNQWIEAKDENRQKAKQAIAEIVGFEFADEKAPGMALEWNRLHSKIKRDVAKKKYVKSSGNARDGNGYRWLYRVAAILLIVSLAGVGVYVYSNKKNLVPKVAQITQKKVIKTGPHEQKTISFSDGSKIILNHNSSISYQTDALYSQTAKVKLDGEAYFAGVKDKAEFKVYTPDGIVQDVGTKFLVTVQKNHSRVVLQAGRVKIRMKSGEDDDQEITMAKGEMLSFDQSNILSKQKVNPSYYTSWATGFMQFNHTSIQKFAGYVEKKFNVKVHIVSPGLSKIRIDGSIYFKSLAGLVRSVSKVIGIPAYQSKDGKIVYLGNPTQANKSN